VQEVQLPIDGTSHPSSVASIELRSSAVLLLLQLGVWHGGAGRGEGTHTNMVHDINAAHSQGVPTGFGSGIVQYTLMYFTPPTVRELLNFPLARQPPSQLHLRACVGRANARYRLRQVALTAAVIMQGRCRQQTGHSGPGGTRSWQARSPASFLAPGDSPEQVAATSIWGGRGRRQ